MVFSKNTRVRLILPESPTPRELFAAQELKRYLFRIFAIELTESPTEKTDVRILLGGPARNPASQEILSKEEFHSLLTGAEGMLIEVREHTLLVAGSEGFDDAERGTIYAVYELLERYFGCTLAAYSHPNATAGEIVPHYDTWEIHDGRYVKAGADRPYRTAIVQYGDSAGNPRHALNLTFFDWLLKNRYNRILTWSAIYEGWRKMGLVEELEKRGIRLSVGHHDSADLWLPVDGNEHFPEPYLQTHPEYYRQNADGTRYAPSRKNDPRGQWIYCSRNEACIEQVSRNMIEWIQKNPLVDTVAFWPKDGVYEQCSCEKCRPHSKVENYLYFQNELAHRIYAVCPHVKVDICVYVDLWNRPKDATVSPNLMIEVSTWGQALRHCGAPDGSGIIGTYYAENAADWRKSGAHVVFYDYYMGVFGNRQRVIPMADEIQSLWKYFAKEDLDGAGTQIECFNLWNHLVNLYTFGRTAYDSSLSFEDCLASVCRLFGEGANTMAELITHLEETLDGQEEILYAGEYMIRHVDKERVYALFDIALNQTSSALCRNNIRLMRMAFRYSELETQDCTNVKDREYELFQTYEDPTGELAYMATHFDSFHHNDPGFGIAFPITNTDTKRFLPDLWYQFEEETETQLA